MIRRNQRLYCLLPDTASCSRLVHLLVESGLQERHIHALAREGTALEGIRKATQMQTTEIRHGLGVGLSMGGIAGILGGLLTLNFPPAGLVLAVGDVLFATTLAGAGFGSLVTVLLSSQILNPSVSAYRKLIWQGHILLILDIPTHRIPMTAELVQRVCPGAKIGIASRAGAVPGPGGRWASLSPSGDFRNGLSGKPITPRESRGRDSLHRIQD